MGMTIISPEKDALHLDATAFRVAAEQRWTPPHVRVSESETGKGIDAVVSPPNQSPFLVTLHDSPTMLNVSGRDSQIAEVALWARSIVDPSVPLWLVSEQWDSHIEIDPDLTEAALVDGWVEHEDEVIDRLADR